MNDRRLYYRNYNREIRGSRPVLARNNTIKHELKRPVDDRPEYLMNSGPYIIALDTETMGFKWYDGEHPFLATISDYDRDFVYRPDDFDDLRRDILNADVIIFHNASFDIHQLVSSGIVTMSEIMGKEIHDTDLLCRCVLGADNGPFGLKDLATEFLDAKAAEHEKRMKEAMKSMGLIKRVDQKKLPDRAFYTTWQAYPELVEKYAMMDTRYTYDLFHMMMDKADEDARRVYDLERRVMPVIIDMEHTGTELDPDKVTVLEADYSSRKKDLEAKLFELNGYEDINLDSDEQVAEFLVRRGVPLTARTKTGQLSTARWALERFAGDEAVDAVLEYAKVAKMLSTYIGPMVNRTTVHPSFWQIGARTGRMSCSNPNMQNLPQRGGTELREMFVPRDGYAFIVSDYASIELRLLAYYMNDERLWNIIENGDPFLWLGSQIYGTEDQTQWPVKRGPLKNGFYAMTYGAGGPKVASTIGGGMSDTEGRALVQSIKSALGVNFRVLNKRIREQIERHGYVKTIAGRKQYVPRDKSYVGLNALIQGSAADIMKQGLINVSDALKPLAGVPLLVVHDEVVSEVITRHAMQALAYQNEALAAATDALTLKVDGKICVNNYAEGK